MADDIERLVPLTLHRDSRLTVRLGGCALGGRRPLREVVALGVCQFTKGHAAGDRLAGQGHIQDQGVEVAAGARVAAPFLDQELGQRGALR